jgi:hypothetical protein
VIVTSVYRRHKPIDYINYSVSMVPKFTPYALSFGGCSMQLKKRGTTFKCVRMVGRQVGNDMGLQTLKEYENCHGSLVHRTNLTEKSTATIF